MVPDQELEELKKQIPLWRIAQDRIPTLKKVGSEFKGICPWHKGGNERTPSFTINDKSGDWLFYCLGSCQGSKKSGNIFQFVQEFDKVGFTEAVEKIKVFAGWQRGKTDVEKTFKPVVENETNKLSFDLSVLAPAESALLLPAPVEWLRNRGISLRTAQKFHVGFIQSAKVISPNHERVNDGWLIFPTIENEKIISLKYRSVVGKDFLRKSGMGTTIFNLETVQPFDDVFVTEGECDCLVMDQAGFNSVSLPSASFNIPPETLDRLIQANTIWLAGDMDEAGNEAMDRLWCRLVHRTFRIEWPDSKDANECFLKVCGGDTEKFRRLVETLKEKARSRPLPNFFDLREIIKSQDDTSPMDDPQRLHFPWSSVDNMAVVRPGDVVSSYATTTGTGKTSFWLQVALYEAIKFGSVVLDYSGELSPKELAQLVTAMLCLHDRLNLKRSQYDETVRRLKDAKFYIGYNPEVSKISQILGDGTEKNPGLLEWAIRRFGAKIVILDHLHFFTSGEKDATVVEAAAMTRIKNLTLKYSKQGLIFIVIGQSRKALPSRQHRVSESSDAKGSEALVVDTKICTPTGFKLLKDLVSGDLVIGSNGCSTKILDVIPQGIRQAYQVTFSDGVNIECDADHLWAVRSPNHKKRGHVFEVRKTSELGNLSWKKYVGYKRNRWHVPLVNAVNFQPNDSLPLDPYLVGALLGDGTLVPPYPQFSNIDQQILENVFRMLPEGVEAKQGNYCTWRLTGKPRGPYSPNILTEKLKAIGIWGHKAETKFVPDLYKIRPFYDRLQLLRGLLDTDGWCSTKGGKIRFGTTSRRLAEDIVFLVQSFGGLAKIHRYKAPKHGNFDNYVVAMFVPHFITPFGLERKTNNLCQFKTKNRSIISVEPTTRKKMACLKVAAEDGLFVCENFIVTHNSFTSTANATYHIHREMKRDIDWDHPENWPSDLLAPETDIRLYKCRTKGPGKSVTRLMFSGANGRFEEITKQKFMQSMQSRQMPEETDSGNSGNEEQFSAE